MAVQTATLDAPTSLTEPLSTLTMSERLAAMRPDGFTPLEKIFAYQFIPPTSDNMVESYDRNFVQEMLNMKIRWEGIPKEGVEIDAWRKWDRTEYFTYNRDVQCKRRRTPVTVKASNISVSYGQDGTFGIRVFEPQDQNKEVRPALVMYHGGGWSHGDPTNDEGLSTFFASELGAVVFGVDYRLAPEHNILAIHEDAYQALDWVCENAPTYRVDLSRVAIWGCSAGGHLAAGVAMRDAKEHHPSRLCQVNLVVPALCHPDAYEEPLKGILVGKLKAAAGLLDPVDPFRLVKPIFDIMSQSLPPSNQVVSPLCQSEPLPTHHAPTHITAAGLDYLLQENIAYSTKLRDAGIDTILEVLPGVPHGFTWAVKANVTKQWSRNQVKVLDAAFQLSRQS